MTKLNIEEIIDKVNELAKAECANLPYTFKLKIDNLALFQRDAENFFKECNCEVTPEAFEVYYNELICNRHPFPQRITYELFLQVVNDAKAALKEKNTVDLNVFITQLKFMRQILFAHYARYRLEQEQLSSKTTKH